MLTTAQPFQTVAQYVLQLASNFGQMSSATLSKILLSKDRRKGSRMCMRLALTGEQNQHVTPLDDDVTQLARLLHVAAFHGEDRRVEAPAKTDLPDALADDVGPGFDGRLQQGMRQVLCNAWETELWNGLPFRGVCLRAVASSYAGNLQTIQAIRVGDSCWSTPSSRLKQAFTNFGREALTAALRRHSKRLSS